MILKDGPSPREGARRRYLPVLAGGILLLVMAGVPLWTCERALAAAAGRAENAPTGKSVEREVFERLVLRLDKQKDQRTTWAYAALAAIIAVSVVRRVFPIPWLRASYLLLASCGAWLVEAIQAGDLYEKRIAFLVSQGQLRQSQLDNAQEFLWLQITWLSYATAGLLLFVGAFLLAVVSGRVDMEGERR